MSFFSILNENHFNMMKKLHKKLKMGQMIETIDSIVSSPCCYLVFGEDHCAKLNQEVLKTSEVKFLCFPSIQQLYVNISDNLPDFITICQEKQLVILEKFDQLHDIDDLFSCLVILKTDGAFD